MMAKLYGHLQRRWSVVCARCGHDIQAAAGVTLPTVKRWLKGLGWRTHHKLWYCERCAPAVGAPLKDGDA